MRVAWVLLIVGCTGSHVTRPLAEVPTNRRSIDITGYTTVQGVYRACDGTATFQERAPTASTAPLQTVAFECDHRTSELARDEVRSVDMVKGRSSNTEVITYAVFGAVAAFILLAFWFDNTLDFSGLGDN